ncbi:uncharacterized protein LOC117785865 [Drosophila innubila]|uniref:uncharacterized protein LOC117785865 n=1 Tax=Drosophila innubila TaxID=198719 RepID=UPI00148B37BB|nr:uncharacterized protein LOC117785865 [Drosophila innubila]
MAMCDVLRMLLLLLAWLTLLQVDAAPGDDEALQQIPKLNHAQVALIAGNATARCKLIPELCSYQLHLFEGHAFSVQLSQNDNNNNLATTTTTTNTPPVDSESIPMIFAVPGHKLWIYAQVERRTKLAKTRNTAKAVGQLQDAYVNTDRQVQKIRFAA